MSVSYIRNCEKCDLPYTVDEFEHNYVTRVGQTAVEDCPVCGMPFPAPKPLKDVKPLGEILKEADDGGA